MPKVVTFGELMVRLQPYNYERFVQADHLEFSFGGGEANVAVSLANYGLDAVYVTKLPAHAIGQAAVNSLRRYGVDTSMIVRGGDRIGIYYNEKGASQRGSVCIYDRAHSAIQESTPSDFDWDVIFEGADWFHFTGITPALGPNMVDACRDACKAAKAHGRQMCCGIDYSVTLWCGKPAGGFTLCSPVRAISGLWNLPWRPPRSSIPSRAIITWLQRPRWKSWPTAMVPAASSAELIFKIFPEFIKCHCKLPITSR